MTENQKKILTDTGPAAILKAQQYDVEWVPTARLGQGSFEGLESKLKDSYIPKRKIGESDSAIEKRFLDSPQKAENSAELKVLKHGL